MHDFADQDLKIPAFLAKLWKLVDEPEFDDLICWSDTGQSFIIKNTLRFTKDVLPEYYKHKNLASFIRQLNLYGFHKVASVHSGGLKSEKDSMEFAHTCFLRDHPYLLDSIKRKIGTGRALSMTQPATTENSKEMTQAEVLAQVLADVSALKGKQASWDQKLASMKRENEALWRELAIFRQKHHKQEQIINRLIHFMVSMVRPPQRNTHGPIRRRYQLMLDDSEGSAKASTSSASGPTIRELDPLEQFLNEPSSSHMRGVKSPSYILPQSVEEVETGGIVGSGSEVDYEVVSPPVSTISEPSPWIHTSDTDEPGMTPINPRDATTPDFVSSPVDVSHIMKIISKQNTATPGKAIPATSTATKPIAKTAVPISFRKKQPKEENTTSATPLIYRLVETPNGPMLEPDPNVLNLGTVSKKEEKTKKPAKQPRKQNTTTRRKPAIKKEPNEDVIIDDLFNIINDTANPVMENVGEQKGEETSVARGDSLTVATQGTNLFNDPIASDLGQHVDQVQGDLDILKELLKGDSYNFDANALLELFNDDPLNLVMSQPSENKDEPASEGNELMTYSAPNLADLADLYVATPTTDLLNSPPPTPGKGLETPIIAPSSPAIPPPAKRRRK